MGFSGFGLFNDLASGGTSYLNTESVGGLNSPGEGSFGSVPDGLFFGLKGANTAQFGKGNYGFLVDTVTSERLAFQYNVSSKENGGAEYNIQKTLGRSVPHFQYKSGKERVLELPIVFTMQQEDRQDVKKAIRWIQGLAYPEYSGETEVDLAPHPVVVVQGELYAKDIWIVRDYQIEWGEARDPYTQLPSEAKVTIQLMEMAQKGKSYSEVIRL